MGKVEKRTHSKTTTDLVSRRFLASCDPPACIDLHFKVTDLFVTTQSTALTGTDPHASLVPWHDKEPGAQDALKEDLKKKYGVGGDWTDLVKNCTDCSCLVLFDQQRDANGKGKEISFDLKDRTTYFDKDGKVVKASDTGAIGRSVWKVTLRLEVWGKLGTCMHNDSEPV